MTERRRYPLPDLERRPAWRDKPIVLPIVFTVLALVLMSKPGATNEEAEQSAQSATVSMRGGAMADCWYDIKKNGITGLEIFCIKHTTERR